MDAAERRADRAAPRARGGARRPGTRSTSPPRCSRDCCTNDSTSSVSTSVSCTRASVSCSCTPGKTTRPPRRVPGAQPLQRRDVRALRRPARARSPRSRCTRPTRPSPSSSTRSTCSASSRCCAPATCSGRSTRPRRSTRSSRGGRRGSTSSASTAPTTTTRCGRPPRSSASRSPSTRASSGCSPRRSISSYMYNHLGSLAEGQHSLAKSLFLGGVTRRFPGMNFAFLEGGVAWAASLYSDIVGHWEKRNVDAMRSQLDPRSSIANLIARVRRRSARSTRPEHVLRRPREPEAMLDEWAACGIERAEDIKTLFVDPFYFGCEADDPMTTHGVQHRGQPVRRRAPRDDGLRHRALGRPRHGRGARGGVGDGRARLDRRGRRSRSSRSRTRCASTPAPTPTSSPAPSSRARSPNSSPRGLTMLDLVHPGCDRSSTAPGAPRYGARRRHRRRPHRRDHARTPSTGTAGHRRARQGRVPGLRRRPHALRRPAPVGSDREPVAAARRHDRARRQLRVLDRAARARTTRLREADDGARRGHADRCRSKAAALGLAVVRRVPRPARRAIAVNAGFLVGHSTMRRAVMGDAATRDPAIAGADRRDGRVAARVARAGGARVLVVARRGPHRRRRSTRPVTRRRVRRVHRARPACCATTPAPTLEFIPTVGPIPAERMELMADMSLAADRPLNWNLLGSLAGTEIYEEQLRASDVAAARGAHVVALALPDMMRMRANTLLETPARLARRRPRSTPRGVGPALADPETRERLRAGADARRSSQALGVLSDWKLMEIAPTTGVRDSEWVGRSLAEVAADAGYRRRRRAARRRPARPTGTARSCCRRSRRRSVVPTRAGPRASRCGRTRGWCSADPMPARTST